ncbi:MAG: hypothetical protein KJP07_07980, partial [Desulfatitalea sp.]|nr:hypothetical protein [Desulfatitalea sp.]
MRFYSFVFVVFVLISGIAMAEELTGSIPGTEVDRQSNNDASKSSPWLAVPMVSSDPKVGTSAGG